MVYTSRNVQRANGWGFPRHRSDIRLATSCREPCHIRCRTPCFLRHRRLSVLGTPHRVGDCTRVSECRNSVIGHSGRRATCSCLHRSAPLSLCNKRHWVPFSSCLQAFGAVCKCTEGNKECICSGTSNTHTPCKSSRHKHREAHTHTHTPCKSSRHKHCEGNRALHRIAATARQAKYMEGKKQTMRLGTF